MGHQVTELDSLSRYFHRRNEVHLVRKLFHLGNGLIWLWLYYNIDAMTREVSMYIFLGLGIVLFALDFLRLRFVKLNRFLLKIMSSLARKSDVYSCNSMSFYALGMSAALFFYQEKIAVLSILFLVFADPLSSYFGIRYGAHQIVANKSVQGSTAGFCTCYLIALIYGLIWAEPTVDLLIFSLLAGVIGSISELLSIFIDDNLTIPVVSGGGMTLLNMAFQIY